MGHAQVLPPPGAVVHPPQPTKKLHRKVPALALMPPEGTRAAATVSGPRIGTSIQERGTHMVQGGRRKDEICCERG